MHSETSKCREVARSCAVLNLRRAARAVTSRYEAVLRPVGLKATQFSLLVAISLRGPVTISHLAEIMVMDRTTLPRNLKPLEKAGLVNVAAGEDRRTRAVTLTNEGRKMLERALPLWEEAQSVLVKGLGEARFDGLLDDLRETVAVARAR